MNPSIQQPGKGMEAFFPLAWPRELLALLHDPCLMLVVLLLLWWIGRQLGERNERLYAVGTWLAGALFVTTLAGQCIVHDPQDLASVIVLALRSGLLAVSMAISTWIVFPIGALLYRCTLGLAWGGLRRLHGSMSSRWSRWTVSRQSRHERRQRAQEDRRLAQERQREQLRWQGESRQRQTTEDQARQRREDVRARCEFFFSLHAAVLGERYTHMMLQAYMRQYMGEDRHPEYVERRGTQLLDLMQQHLAKAQPAPRFRSLEDIALWFQSEKQKIDHLPLDERAQRILLVNLREKYDELTSRFLEELT